MYSKADLRELGLNPGEDITEKTVRAAYAAKLKAVRPDEDRDAFMRLRAAYERLRSDVQHGPRTVTVVPVEDLGDLSGMAPSKQSGAAQDEALNESSPQSSPISYEWIDTSDLDAQPAVPAPAAQDWARIEEEPVLPAQQQAPTQDSVTVAMNDIEALVASPFARSSLKSWKAILDRPELDGIDTFQWLSDELRTYICEETGFYEHTGHPTPPDWLTEELMAMLEGRFGWSQSRARDPFIEDQTSWLIRLRPMLKYAGDDVDGSAGRRRRRDRRHKASRDPGAPPPAPQSKIYSTKPRSIWNRIVRWFFWFAIRATIAFILIRAFLGSLG